MYFSRFKGPTFQCFQSKIFFALYQWWVIECSTSSSTTLVKICINPNCIWSFTAANYHAIIINFEEICVLSCPFIGLECGFQFKHEGLPCSLKMLWLLRSIWKKCSKRGGNICTFVILIIWFICTCLEKSHEYFYKKLGQHISCFNTMNWIYYCNLPLWV